MSIESINNSYVERIGKQYGFDNTIMTNGEFFQHQLPQLPSSNATESSRLVHIKPTPKSDNCEEQIQNEPSLSTKTTTTLELYGDGDSITNEVMLPYLKLLNQGKIIDNVTISEVEISAQTLHDLLSTVKPTLKALNISRVALDHEHLEMLNKLELGLEFLSLSYVEADQSNAFKEQKNEKGDKPFNINKLEFKRFCPNLKFLQLRGISLKKETFDTILDTYSSSLEILILENIKTQEQSKKELLQHILQNLAPFRNMKGLSLANNNLDAIDFSEEQEENNKILFPENLRSLNLNGCNLDHKQIYDLMTVLSESRCPLQDLHLVGSYLYVRTFEAISKFAKTTGNAGIFVLEISKLPIDPSGRNIFKDPKSKHSVQIKMNDLFTELLDASADLEALKSLKNSPNKPEWISQLTNQYDFAQSLPYLLKIFRETKFFNDAYRKNLVDFSTNPKMMIPKHDFNELLSKIASEMNNTEVLGETSIVEVYVRLIRHVHPTLLRDDDWAKLPLKNQRDKFLELMKELGYNHIVKKHKDCFEDQFVMAIKKLKQVSYDYTLATFSLFWYYNQVSVKFNLSDDWYLDRKQRLNRYAPPNQDFLISFCSEWNNHTNDYVFELDIKDEGEPEIKFKSSIWKDGDLNVAKALLIAIDKGFVMLEALHKIELFDKGGVFKGVEDSKNVRKILKEKLRKYAKSQDFQNLLRQEIAILGEPEVEEEAVGEEQQ